MLDAPVTAPKVPSTPAPRQAQSEPSARLPMSRGSVRLEAEPPASKADADRPDTLEIPEEFRKKLGKMQAMDDASLDTVQIAEPFDEQEAKRIQMVNRYLEQMQASIQVYWRRPPGATAAHAGVIRFELDGAGNLVSAELQLPSGHSALDKAALDAVKSVPKFPVPPSRLIVERYYRYLRFSYNGGDDPG